MADNVTANAGSGGATFRSYQESGGAEHPAAVLEYVTGGSAGAWTFQAVQLTTGMPVQPQTGSTWAVTQSGAWSVTISGTPTVAVSGTVTVDTELPAAAALADGTANPTAPLVGACLEAFNGTTWDRLKSSTTHGLQVDVTQVQGTVTVAGTVTANQGGSNWSVNLAQYAGSAAGAGNAVHVQPGTGAVFTVSQQNLATADYDTGAGVSTQAMVGIALPANGGPVAGGTSSNPLRVDPTGTTTQPVSGTVSVSGTATVAGSVTIDYDTGAGVQNLTMVGLALPASGGAVAGGTSSNPIRTDPTGSTTQPVSGSVSASQSGTWTVQPGNTQNATPWLVQDSDGTHAQGTFFDLDTGAGTEWQPGVSLRISASGGSVEAKGQKAMASSIPVAIASDQTAFPVSQSGTWNVGTLTSITNTVTVDTELPAAAALADATANPTAPLVGACLEAFNGTTWDRLRADANKALLVTSNGPATYSACIIDLVAASSATDIFTVTGSGTKTVKITKVLISATQTTAGEVNIVFLTRSTANSAGTSTNPTAVPNDPNDPAATATANAYTANPTAGTLVGDVRAFKLNVGSASGNLLVWEETFGNANSKPITLRGTGSVFAINLNAVTVTGNKFTVTVEWTEDNS